MTANAARALEATPDVRIPYVRPCVLSWDGRSAEGVVCNLSMLGVYVTFPRSRTDTMPEPGRLVKIAFLVPGDATPVDADAWVASQNLEDAETVDGLPPGCGLRFASLHPTDHHRIGTLIDEYVHERHPKAAIRRPYSGPLRIPYVRSCVLEGDGNEWTGVLCNLSLVGAYVALDAIPIGQSLHLSFKAAGGHKLQMPCHVAWVNAGRPPRADELPPGCGLSFDSLDDIARGRIQTLIDEYESLPRARVT